jgi:orotate phosphoribosyltransferase
MATPAEREELRALLKSKSVRTGDFTLASGKKSDLYVDCRVTTLDARGAVLVGKVLLDLLKAETQKRGLNIAALGGLTMGADPISLSVAMASSLAGEAKPTQAFVVRKEPKGHGRGKRIEGNFAAGDTVVVVDDVITTGDSTLKAIEAIEAEGGKVAFALILVDRQEGGRENIEGKGYPVVAAFTRADLVGSVA